VQARSASVRASANTLLEQAPRGFPWIEPSAPSKIGVKEVQIKIAGWYPLDVVQVFTQERPIIRS
jgi:hypothetical protein